MALYCFNEHAAEVLNPPPLGFKLVLNLIPTWPSTFDTIVMKIKLNEAEIILNPCLPMLDSLSLLQYVLLLGSKWLRLDRNHPKALWQSAHEHQLFVPCNPSILLHPSPTAASLCLHCFTLFAWTPGNRKWHWPLLIPPDYLCEAWTCCGITHQETTCNYFCDAISMDQSLRQAASGTQLAAMHGASSGAVWLTALVIKRLYRPHRLLSQPCQGQAVFGTHSNQCVLHFPSISDRVSLTAGGGEAQHLGFFEYLSWQ